MNTNDDSFLTSLLQYHTRLIDQKFVDNIINQIQQRKAFRVKIMILAFILASAVAVPLLLSIAEKYSVLIEFIRFSPYLVSCALLSVLAFFVWISNEDF